MNNNTNFSYDIVETKATIALVGLETFIGLEKQRLEETLRFINEFTPSTEPNS